MTIADRSVAIVTGANRGIGFAIAARLAALGMHVVAAGRDREQITAAAARLSETPNVSVEAALLDVTHEESIGAAVEQIMSRHGRIDALINNAGIVVDKGQKASAPDFDRVRLTLETNLLGPWRCSAAVAQHMITAGYGRIVNVTSHLGSTSTPGAYGGVSYRVSKSALNALTRVLAAELDGTGVLVNACSPGQVRTRMGLPSADRDADQAADTPVWLATLPDGGPTGGLWFDRQPMDW